MKGVVIDLEHFQYRLVRDAINTASAAYWERRAQEFESARPKIGDFHGRATRVELAARFDRLTKIATACRNRARLCELTPAEESLILECINSDPLAVAA